MKQDENNLEEWATVPDSTITTTEIDMAVMRMLELDAVLDEKKQESKLANEAYEKQRHHVLDLLTKTNKTKYFVENIGTVSKAIKYSVSLPKDPDEKVKVLNYFRGLGDDVFNNMVSIYYQTLNSYYNSMREKDPTFTIDGVGEPTRTEELRFRKA